MLSAAGFSAARGLFRHNRVRLARILRVGHKALERRSGPEPEPPGSSKNAELSFGQMGNLFSKKLETAGFHSILAMSFPDVTVMFFRGANSNGMIDFVTN